MSGRDRSTDNFTLINAFIAFLVFCLLLIVVWFGSASNTERRIQAQTNSQHYADSAAKEIQEKCGLVATSSYAECVEKIVKATREDQRSQYDLKAQIDSAQWAFWILVISVAGVFVTIAGIAYVRLTLREMEATNIIGEKSVEASTRAAVASERSVEVATTTIIENQRAWVKATISLDGPLVFENGEAKIRLRATTKNVGLTPAQFVDVTIRMFANSSTGIGPIDVQRSLCDEIRLRPIGQGFGYSLFPNDEITQTIYIALAKEDVARASQQLSGFMSVYVIGCVDYTTVFRDRHHQTGFIFDLVRFEPAHPQNHFIIEIAAGTLPIERIRLVFAPYGSFAD